MFKRFLIFILTSLLLASVADAQLNASLRNCWDFSEGSGTNVADAVGSNTLRLYGSPNWTNGKINRAILLNKINQYGMASDIDNGVVRGYTWAVIFKRRDNDAALDQFLISNEPGSIWGGWFNAMYAGNTYQYRNYKGGTTYTDIGAGSLTDTTNFHLGFGTWNGTNIKLMIDTTQADRIASATYLGSSGNFNLGRRNLTASDFGFYYVDLIAFWNTSVNGDNQAQLYNSGNMMNCTSIIDAAPADTCTYGGSGDWIVRTSDNCVCRTPVSMSTNSFIMIGNDGTFNGTAACDIYGSSPGHWRANITGAARFKFLKLPRYS